MKKPAILLLSIIFSGSAFANPVDGVVASGNVVITQTTGSTQIQQNSQQAIINWQSFNIWAGEKTHFQQPQGGVALNRINPTQGPSQIYGQLTATGKIILVNQSGIFFAPGSYVNVGGIIASTSGISDSNFLAGKYVFDQSSLYNGSVINKGTIIAADNGLVALIGTGVSNEGVIQARMGNVVLASGNKFTVDLYGDQLINFAVDEGTSNAGVDENGNNLKNGVNNSGTIIADGGTIQMSAKTASSVVDHVINMDGIVQANTVSQKNGVVILGTGNEDSVRVAGKVYASGKSAGEKGGVVKVLAKKVTVEEPTEIDVSGDAGGGEILIGGNYQGKGPELNALTTIINPGVTLNADALTQGDGGKIIAWADQATYVNGTFSARGGALGGNGGFVETSGHYLGVGDNILVNLQAPLGEAGAWLLDPENITISSSSTAGGSFSGGDPNTFTPSADNSIVNVTTLNNILNTANVIISTGSTGTQLGNITISGAISWTNANPTLATYLYLQAANNIAINSAITMNTSGQKLILENGAGGTITQSAGIGGVGQVVKKGDGVARFTVQNTYSGGTQIDGGIIDTGLAGSAHLLQDVFFSTTGNFIFNGGQLDYNGQGNSSLANNIVLQGDGKINNTQSGFTVTLNGAISDDSAISGVARKLTKTGQGTLVLTGTNTYTGGTDIIGDNSGNGALTVASNSNLGNGGDVTISSGGRLRFTMTSAVDFSGRQLIIGAGTNNLQVLGGAFTATWSGNVTSSAAGTLSLDTSAGNIKISGNIYDTTGALSLSKISSNTAILSGISNSYTGTTTITAGTLQIGDGGANGSLGTGTVTNNSGLVFNSASNLSITSVINGTSTLAQSGSGITTLSGNNGYTGTTTVSAGTLSAAHANALGATSSGTTVSSGATLDINGVTLAAEPITINGGGISSNGALTGTGISSVGAITLGSASTIGVNAGATFTITGNITGSGFALTLAGAGNGTISSIIGTGAGTVTKSGTGTWLLSGLNTYTGTTTVSSGTLSFNTIQNVSGGASALGAPTTVSNGTIALGATGVLQFVGSSNQTSNRVINLTGSGGTIDASGTSDAASLALSGGVTGNANNLVLTGTSLATQSGVISITTGALTKNGTGLWSLLGSNTFSGAVTINSGYLLTTTLANINSNSGIGTGATSSDITIGSSGALIYANGGAASTDRAIALSGGDGSLIINSGVTGNVTFNGGVKGTGNLILQNNVTAAGINLALASTTINNSGTITNSSGGSGGGSVIINSNVGSSVTEFIQNSNSSAFNIQGALTNGKIFTNNGLALLTVSGGVTGSGDIILNNNNSTANGITLSTSLLSNSGTITNSGSGTGSTLISAGIDSSVTGIIENSLTSGLNITGPITVNSSSGTTLTNNNAALLTVSGGISGSGNVVLNNNGSGVNGITISGASINNSGTLTNSGISSGNVLISANIGFNVTGVTQNSSTSSLTLSGTNAYTSLTTITAGSLIYGANDVFNNAAPITINGGTLDIGTFTDTVGTVTLSSGNITGTTGILTGSSYEMQSGSVDAILGGSGTLNKTTSGSVTFTKANNYTGLTTVSAGSFIFGVDDVISSGAVTVNGGTLDLGAFNDTVGTVTLSSGNINSTTGILTSTGTFEMQSGSASAILAGTGVALNKTTAGTVVLTGANIYTGATTISAGSLQIGNAGTSGTLGLGNIVNNSSLVFNRSDSFSVSNAISGTGAVTQSGSGTLTLSGGNSYDGLTTVSSGTLTASNATALGSAVGSTLVSNGATLNINGLTIAEAVTLNGNGVGGAGALTSTGTSVLSGLVTLGSSSTIGITSGTLSLSNTGTITGSGNGLTLLGSGGTIASIIGTGTGTVTKLGSGTWTLTGANTYSGATTIDNGTLALSGSGAITNSSLTINNSGIFNISGTSGSTIVSLSSASTSSSVALGNKILTLSAGVGTYAGSIGGTGGLTLLSSGTQTLSGTNSYSGNTTITSGTLALSGSGSILNSSSVDIAAAGTFDISGATNGTSVISMSGSGATALGGKTLTFTNPINNYNGNIGGTGGIVKDGSTSFTLGGTSTYTGGTTILNGTLQVSAASALGGSNVSNSINIMPSGTNTATLQINASSLTNTLGHIIMTSGSGTANLVGNGSTIANAIDLTNSNNRITALSSSTINGIISGSGALTIYDSGFGGILTLGAANTYTGVTSINAGAILKAGINNILPFGSGKGNVVVNGTLDLANRTVNVNGLTGSGSIESDTAGSASLLTVGNNNTTSQFDGVIRNSVAASFALTKTGTGTFTLTNANTYTGASTISGGTLALTGSGSIANSNIAGSGGIFDITGTTSGASVVSLTGSDGILLGSKTLTVTNGASSTFSGVISDTSSGGFTLSGGTLTLSGLNSYTGPTTVSGGTLIAGNNSALGSSAVEVASGATLQINTGMSIGNALTLNGSGVGSNGALVGLGTSSYTGLITLGSASSIGANAAAMFTISSGITDGTSSFGLTKVGLGNLILSTANTFDGGTTINAGTLTVGDNAALGTGTLNFANAGTTLQSNMTINLNNTFIVDGIATLSGSNSLTLSGAGTLNALLRNTNTAETVLSGVLSGSNGILQNSSNTLTLSNSNSYDGITTVSQGTLRVTSNGALGSITNGTTVLSGGTLDFQGSYSIQENITLNGSGVGGNGALTGTGAYAGAITLGSSSVISTNSTLLLNGTIDSALAGVGGLTLQGSGSINLNNIIGSTALASLTTNADTIINVGSAAITTSGAQNYNGNITISSDATTFSTSNNAINFSGISSISNSGLTINSGSGDIYLAGAIGTDSNKLGAMALNSTGTTTLGGAVYAASVVTDSGGTTVINGGAVKTAGVQTYNDIISLGENTTFTADDAAISLLNANNNFTNAVSFFNTGANDVTVLNSNALTLGESNIGGNLLATSTNTILQSGAIIASGIIANSVGGTILTNTSNSIGSFAASNTSSGDINLYNDPQPLVLGLINQVGGGNVIISNDGDITVDNTITTDGGDVQLTTVSPDTNERILTVNNTIASNGGDIILNATNSSSGNATALIINGVLNSGTGSGGTLTISGGLALNASPQVGAGNITLQGNGNDLSLGTLNFSVPLTASVVRNIIVSGDLTTSDGGNLTLQADNGNTGVGGVAILSGASIVSSGDLTINGSTGVGTANSAGISIEGVISAAGTINLNSNRNGFIQLGADVTSTGGAINFDQGVQMTNSVTVNAGSHTINFNGYVYAPTETLTLQNTTGDVTFNNTINLANLVTVAQPYAVFINGSASLFSNLINFLNTNGVTLRGNNTFTNGIATPDTSTTTLAGNITSGSDITLSTAGTVNLINNSKLSGDTITLGDITSNTSAFDLSITNTGASSINSLTESGAGVGTSLTKLGSSVLTIAAASNYSGFTTITDGILQAGDANVFSANSDVNLSDNAGAALDLNNFSQTIASLTGGGTTGGNVMLGSGTLTTGNGFTTTYSGAISGTGNLIKQGSGTFTLAGVSSTFTGTTSVTNGILQVAQLKIVGGQSSLGNSIGAININGNNATLVDLNSNDFTSRNISIGASGGGISANGNLDLNGTVDGAGAFVLGGEGQINLNGVVGSTLSSLTSYAATLGINTDITTIGSQSYNGSVVLGANAVLTSSGNDNIIFANTIDGANDLTINTAGLTRFDNTIGGNIALNSLTTDAAGSTFINTSGIDTVGLQQYNDNSIINITSTLTGSDISFLGSSLILIEGLTINNSTTGNITATIKASGDLTKMGAGALALSNADNVNFYSGAINVNQGTVVVTADGALGSDFGGTTVATGATLDFQNVNYSTAEALELNGGTLAVSTGSSSYAGAITLSASSIIDVAGTDLTISDSITDGSGTFGLTKNGVGNLILPTANTYDGDTTFNAGTLIVSDGTSLGTGTLKFMNAGTTLQSSTAVNLANNFVVNGAATLSGSNDLKLSGAGTLNALLTNTNTGATVLSGVLSGSDGITHDSNNTLTLSNSNSYNGATAVNQGTLIITSNNALGSSAGGTTVASGAVLDIQNTNYSTFEALDLSGTLSASTGSSHYAGDITLSAASIINVAGTQLTIGGGISGTFGLTKDGSGNLILSAVNSYSGDTIFNAGTLTVGNDAALGTGVLNFVNIGTTLQSSAAVTIGNDYIINGSAAISGSNSLEMSGTGTLNALLTNTNAATTTLSGVLTGSDGITQDSSNTLELSNTNHYDGATTINQGTLIVAADGALGSLANGTVVAAGATLDIQNVNYSLSEALTLNGAGVDNNGALIGSGFYAGAITLDSTSVIASDAILTLAGTIDSASSGSSGLTLKGNGTINLNSIIGSTALASLTTDAATTISINGAAIITTGEQNYNGSVVLGNGATTTLTTTDSAMNFANVTSGNNTGLTINTGIGDISFSGVIGAGSDLLGDLALNSTGTTTLGGAVNAASIITDLGGSTIINGGAITTTGAQTYNDIITLGANTTFTAGSAAIDLSNASNSFTKTVSFNNTGANDVTVSNLDALTLGASSVGGNLFATSGSTITQTDAITANGIISNSVGGTLFTNASNSIETFAATNTGSGDIHLVNGLQPLTLGIISQSGGGNTTITNNGDMTVGNTISSDTGDITLTTTTPNTDASILTVNANISTDNGGSINLTAANDTHLLNPGTTTALIINALLDTGTGTPQGTLTISGGLALNSSPQIGKGNITLQGNGKDLSLGTVNFTTPVTAQVVRNITITGDLTSSNGSALTLEADYLNLGTGGVIVQNSASVQSAGALAILGSSIDIEGQILAAGNINLTINSSSSNAIQLGANAASTGGDVHFNDAINLTNAVQVIANGNITLHAITGNSNSLALVGSAANNNFIFNGSANNLSSLTVNGGTSGADTLNFGAVTSSRSIALTSAGTHGFNGSDSSFGGLSFSNIDSIIGNTSTGNTLTGSSGAANWLITGSNTGSYTNTNSLNFTNFQNLTGTANNVFKFNDAALISGTLNGAGNSTLDISAYTTPVSVNVAGSSTGIGGTMSGITQFIGTDASAGDSNSTFVGPSASTWTLSGINDGTVGIYTFNNFGKLTGGTGTNTFNVTAGGSAHTITSGSGTNTYNFTGGSVTNIVGSAGMDSLNYGALATALDITLSSVNSNGVNGGASQGVASFTNINAITGTSSASTALTGAALASTWSISGNNTGTYSAGAGILSFSAFRNLAGSSANDTFAFTSGGSVTSINGGAGGVNSLNYSNYGSAIIMDLQTASATAITGTFSNINRLIGDNNSYGTLKAANTTNIWNITGSNAGSVTGLTNGFSKISNLLGGSTNANTFNFGSNGKITGIIDGGNTTNINAFVFASGTKITLTSIDTGSVKLSSDNSNVASFIRVQQATSSGSTGLITLPTGKAYPVTYYNSPINTNGEIGDPFYFFNYIIGSGPTPTPTPTPIVPGDNSNLTNVMTGATPTSPTFLGGDSLEVTFTNDAGLDSLLSNMAEPNLDARQVNCFKANILGYLISGQSGCSLTKEPTSLSR